MGGFKLFLRFFVSDYSPDGRDMDMPFSTLEDNCTYVPQVETKQTPYPFIVGNVKDMDPELYDWVSAERDYDYYNLTLDLKDILSPEEFEEACAKSLFSRVKDYIGTDNNDKEGDDAAAAVASPDNPDVATAGVVSAISPNFVAADDAPDVTSRNALEDM